MGYWFKRVQPMWQESFSSFISPLRLKIIKGLIVIFSTAWSLMKRNKLSKIWDMIQETHNFIKTNTLLLQRRLTEFTVDNAKYELMMWLFYSETLWSNIFLRSIKQVISLKSSYRSFRFYSCTKLNLHFFHTSKSLFRLFWALRRWHGVNISSG